MHRLTLFANAWMSADADKLQTKELKTWTAILLKPPFRTTRMTTSISAWTSTIKHVMIRPKIFRTLYLVDLGQDEAVAKCASLMHPTAMCFSADGDIVVACSGGSDDGDVVPANRGRLLMLTRSE